MRIIDADKFKEDLFKLWDYNSVDGITATTVLKQVIRDLDNAPELGYEDGVLSVENATRRAIELEEAYNNGWSDGFNEGENERPKGEWIKITKNGTIPVEYICSVCGRKIFDNYELSVPQSVYYPFCHCGADMKGGAE